MVLRWIDRCTQKMSYLAGVTNEQATGGSAPNINNGKTKAGSSNAGSTLSSSPRKTYGYSFNNGNVKQPILRAQESYPPGVEGSRRNVSPGGVGLNFNFWMEHNYIVDRDVTQLTLSALESGGSHTSHIVKHDLSKVNNVLVLSVQGVDPRELNDNIQNLPFLNAMSCMPIRHIHEESSPMVSFDESIAALANTDQQWQYLEVCNQNAKLLWCDKPSVQLHTIAGLGAAELFTQYTLTFLGVHTQWQDDIIMYSEMGGNSAATVNAFQEQARQKLIGCKDAPAYMLQLMCDLTKPPQPGDIFGRCSRVKAKETGMFLYRPGTASANTPAATGRLIILWQRTKEIDILEEAASSTVAHNKCVIPNSTEHTDVLSFVKVQPAAVAGARSRFQEVLDLVLTLSKAVSRATPAPNKADSAVCNTQQSENVPSDEVPATDLQVISTYSATVPIVSSGEGDTSVHQYFSAELQDSLRQQYQTNAMKSALDRLVLSPAMQDIMGYVTSRSNGYEDFLDTSDRCFHRKMNPEPAAGNDNPMGRKRAMSLEDGEELEEPDEVDARMEVVNSTARPNKKTYFSNSDDGGADSGSESDADDAGMAALMATNARKRKAQEAVLEEQAAEEGEERDDNSTSSLDRILAAKRAKLVAPPAPPAPPPPPPRPPAPRSAPPSASKPSAPLKQADDDCGEPEVVRTVTSKSAEADAQMSVIASPTVVVCRSAPALKIDSVPVPTKAVNTGTVINGAAEAVSAVDTGISRLAPNIVTPLQVCALDCEMCSTAAGLELTRLTVLCPVNGVVYDALVRPELEILDYHTEFSGITKESMLQVTTSFAQVQEMLRCLISRDTIIVGHSADTDLKVLKLVHGRVIDTAALFPHPSGLPFKHALKKLAREHLHKDIQDGTDGHDSVQDAAIALELAFLKAQRGDAVGVAAPWSEDPVPKCSVIQGLVHQLMSTNSATGARSVECLLGVHVHGVPSVLGYDVPAWEDHAFGYRPEGDSCLNVALFRAALQAELEQIEQSNETSATASAHAERLRQQIQQIHTTRHSSTEEAVAHAVQDLHSLRAPHTNSTAATSSDCDAQAQKKGLVFVELTCPGYPEDGHSERSGDSPMGAEDDRSDGYYYGGDHNDHDDGQGEGEGEGVICAQSSGRSGEVSGPLCPLAQVDCMVEQLYQAAPEGTLLVVVTQGSMLPMKLLASRKTRNRWEQAQIKRKQSQVGSTRVPWDALVDEGRLIAAAAHATAGAAFVGIKGCN